MKYFLNFLSPPVGHVHVIAVYIGFSIMVSLKRKKNVATIVLEKQKVTDIEKINMIFILWRESQLI